jgi:hypothetical protein
VPEAACKSKESRTTWKIASRWLACHFEQRSVPSHSIDNKIFVRKYTNAERIPDGNVFSFSESRVLPYRGPFSTTSDYLQSSIRAELSRYYPITLSELDEMDKEEAQKALQFMLCLSR